jgi:hypothetical protein
MNLHIQIENGQPINHPALEENLIAAYGSVPSDWESFVRVEKPSAKIYEIVEDDPSYEKIDGVWTDVWTVRNMTPVEKVAFQSVVKSDWASFPFNTENRSTWIFDEEFCRYVPPVPYPKDPAPEGQDYRWLGTENNWVLAPEMPKDDNRYTWDYKNWSWVKIIPPTANT